jgi:hypothetical protein
MSELYTIDKIPQTELEKFQSLRIDALMKRNEYLESKLKEAKELLNNIVDDASQIEVKDSEQL